MGNFFDKSEKLTIEEKIDILGNMLDRLCNRVDELEECVKQMQDDFQKANEEIKECCEESTQVTIHKQHSARKAKLNNEVRMKEKTENHKPVPSSGQYVFDSSKVVKNCYCGSPDGCGFYDDNCTSSVGIRSLYTFLLIDSLHAYFYPLTDKMPRFRNNAISLLMPVCDIDGDITECETFIVNAENYGFMELKDGEYWEVKKRCIVKCVGSNE